MRTVQVIAISGSIGLMILTKCIKRYYRYPIKLTKPYYRLIRKDSNINNNKIEIEIEIEIKISIKIKTNI